VIDHVSLWVVYGRSGDGVVAVLSLLLWSPQELLDHVSEYVQAIGLLGGNKPSRERSAGFAPKDVRQFQGIVTDEEQIPIVLHIACA